MYVYGSVLNLSQTYLICVQLLACKNQLFYLEGAQHESTVVTEHITDTTELCAYCPALFQ